MKKKKIAPGEVETVFSKSWGDLQVSGFPVTQSISSSIVNAKESILSQIHDIFPNHLSLTRKKKKKKKKEIKTKYR